MKNSVSLPCLTFAEEYAFPLFRFTLFKPNGPVQLHKQAVCRGHLWAGRGCESHPHPRGLPIQYRLHGTRVRRQDLAGSIGLHFHQLEFSRIWKQGCQGWCRAEYLVKDVPTRKSVSLYSILVSLIYGNALCSAVHALIPRRHCFGDNLAAR